MTMMNTLEAKGYLKKAMDGRAYRYRPAIPERRVVTAMVREFVERVFDGSAAPLLAHLVAQSDLSEDERDELRRLIDEAQ
jgi:predicted transcriptional regulator